MKNFHNGFTLSEVLVSLVIIGVIASLTIPVIKQDSVKEENVARLKKAYSTLSHVTNMIIENEGRANPAYGGWATSTANIYNKYVKYTINAKECGSKGNDCFAKKYTLLNNQTVTSGSRYTFVMTDGVQVSFPNTNTDFSNNCSLNAAGSRNVCQLILVDVNGSKKPNKVGKDIFSLSLKSTGLYPSGCETKRCSTKNDGYGCACKVLREGAVNY